MSHSITLDPSSVTLEPGGSAQPVVATISNVPADVTVTDVLSAVVGSVSASANVTLTIDHPEPVVEVADNQSGATYQIASPVQDAGDPTIWTCDIQVSI